MVAPARVGRTGVTWGRSMTLPPVEALVDRGGTRYAAVVYRRGMSQAVESPERPRFGGLGLVIRPRWRLTN